MTIYILIYLFKHIIWNYDDVRKPDFIEFIAKTSVFFPYKIKTMKKSLWTLRNTKNNIYKTTYLEIQVDWAGRNNKKEWISRERE